MGGGRAPCCDKSKVKRGPWSPAEDMRLITFIQKNGHPNWRSLPKHAGLLRCGKSCRLRWINYLRPDVKRGNFTPEEEEMIIKLHYSMGNRWSKIASLLPGRTDNEIKNVWNTYLKKKSERYEIEGAIPASSSSASRCSNGEQNTNIVVSHSSDSDNKEDGITSSSPSSTSSSATTTEEELMGNGSSSNDHQDQGEQGEVIDNSMIMYNINMDEPNNQGAGAEDGILEIPPSIEEEDINDIWSMLDDLDNQAVVAPALYNTLNNVDLEVPPLQSSIDQVLPELGGGGGEGEGHYTKWLRYFENELQLAVLGGGGATAETTTSTTTAHDDDQLQIEPPSSCCNLGEFPFISWPPDSSPHHNFGF